MPDFSIILQDPQVRSIVQENILERAFHDALFPRLLFRGEAQPVPWPAGIGDSQVFSAPGLIPIDARPGVPGVDPVPVSYPMEQWTAQLQQYHGTIDTHMPTSMMAIVNLFLRNAHQLGMQAAKTLNVLVRNRLYAAALSGHTVADGAQSAVTTLRVKRLNGFTRARNPNLTGASLVRFDYVSASNPLSVTIRDNTGPSDVIRNVVGWMPDTPGDEQGPGSILLDSAVTVLDRAYVLAYDRTDLIRVGGGFKVDDVGSGDIPTFADVRVAIASFWDNNVPEHPDGRFHAHMDAVTQTKLFGDPEFQRLLTSLPDYYMYKQFSIGEMLNTVFFRNDQCPTPEKVQGGLTGTYDPRDPFVGELYSNGNPSTGVKIHRMIFTSQGAIMEYYSDLSQLITEAGLNGVVADPRIVNNGIEINSERIQMLIRAPMNRLMDQVSTTWKFIGDWPLRTDAATGSQARYKRVKVIEHGE